MNIIIIVWWTRNSHCSLWPTRGQYYWLMQHYTWHGQICSPQLSTTCCQQTKCLQWGQWFSVPCRCSPQTLLQRAAPHLTGYPSSESGLFLDWGQYCAHCSWTESNNIVVNVVTFTYFKTDMNMIKILNIILFFFFPMIFLHKKCEDTHNSAITLIMKCIPRLWCCYTMNNNKVS